MSSIIYTQVSERDVPDGIVWITPRRNQGQAGEVSYSRGIPAGKAADMDADDGDPWMRVRNAEGKVTYYRAITDEKES